MHSHQPLFYPILHRLRLRPYLGMKCSFFQCSPRSCTNLKFIKRFAYLEKNTLRRGRSLKDMNLDEMNKIWEQAKDYD